MWRIPNSSSSGVLAYFSVPQSQCSLISHHLESNASRNHQRTKIMMSPLHIGAQCALSALTTMLPSHHGHRCLDHMVASSGIRASRPYIVALDYHITRAALHFMHTLHTACINFSLLSNAMQDITVRLPVTMLVSHKRALGNPAKPVKLKPGHHIEIRLYTLLILSNDIEINPSPRISTIYPCGLCNCKIGWDSRSVVLVIHVRFGTTVLVDWHVLFRSSMTRQHERQLETFLQSFFFSWSLIISTQVT